MRCAVVHGPVRASLLLIKSVYSVGGGQGFLREWQRQSKMSRIRCRACQWNGLPFLWGYVFTSTGNRVTVFPVYKHYEICMGSDTLPPACVQSMGLCDRAWMSWLGSKNNLLSTLFLACYLSSLQCLDPLCCTTMMLWCVRRTFGLVYYQVLSKMCLIQLIAVIALIKVNKSMAWTKTRPLFRTHSCL